MGRAVNINKKYIHTYMNTCMSNLKATMIQRGSTFSVTLALDGVGHYGQAPALFPSSLIAGTHCIGGWLGPRTGLDVQEKF